MGTSVLFFYSQGIWPQFTEYSITNGMPPFLTLAWKCCVYMGRNETFQLLLEIFGIVNWNVLTLLIGQATQKNCASTVAKVHFRETWRVTEWLWKVKVTVLTRHLSLSVFFFLRTCSVLLNIEVFCILEDEFKCVASCRLLKWTVVDLQVIVPRQ